MSGFKSVLGTLKKYLPFPPREKRKDSDPVSNQSSEFSVSEDIKNLINKNKYEIYIVSANDWVIRFNLLSMTPTELLTYSKMKSGMDAFGAWSPFGQYVQHFNKAGPNGEPISLNTMAELLFKDDGVEGWPTPVGHGNRTYSVPYFEFNVDADKNA